MRSLLPVLLLLLLPVVAAAQWTNRYPLVETFDHQVYLEGYELPVMNAGAMDPAPSPDDESVAFTARGWLWVMDADTRAARRLTDSPHVDSRPEWSPGGESLVFVRDTGETFDIVEIDVASGDERVLVDLDAVSIDPAYAPDGRYVYYASAEGGPLEVWRVSLDDLRREPVSAVAQGQRRSIARRPQLLDESLVIFLRKQGYHDAVELLNVPAGERTVLIEDWITSQADFALSPDGRHLAYTWPAGDGHELRVLAVREPSTSVLLTRSEGMPLAPAFSADGDWVWFSEADESERLALKRVPFAGGDVETVEISGWDFGAPTGRLVVRTIAGDAPIAARLSVSDASGHPLVPERGAVRFEGQTGRVFFYASGEIELLAPAGPVTVSAVNGLATPEATAEANVRAGETTTLTVELDPVWDAAAAGWYSGDNHFHLNYGGIYRLDPADIVADLEAESVDIAFPLLANLHNRFLEQNLIDWRRDERPIIEFGQEVRAHFLGHVGLIGVDETFWPWVWGPGYQVYGEDDRLNAKALQFARAKGGLGGYVHPVAGQDPFPAGELAMPRSLVADAVLGHVDMLEIACLWTDEIGTATLWHSLLNVGVVIAASAGSDVMTDFYRTMAIGSTRVYVRPDGEFGTRAYLSALEAGRSFVTNGPMLEFDVAGSGPGGVVKAGIDSADWTLTVHSALPYEKVELFVNGEVVNTLGGNADTGTRRYAGTLDVPEGGWVTARVTGPYAGWPGLDSYVYAETSPVWFGDIGSTSAAARRASAAKLLEVLELAEQSVSEGYGRAPIPDLLEHFGAARDRLERLAGL